MSDRELLELAAKAAGINLQWMGGPVEVRDGIITAWNPLFDDGDAMRLAVKLSLGVFCFKEEAMVRDTKIEPQREWHGGNDPYAATRRAIVRAAAEIGNGRSQE